ncbi:MAG: nucleotidyltransferase family protein [Mobilicoccus sp.]|nr:nucleotidyltransferase family protein [Mobilicoccus sp.]
MSTVSSPSLAIRETMRARRDIVAEILTRYGATNLRLFGSVARGEANDDSDVDFLVDLIPGGGNPLLCVSGIAEELSQVLDRRVDVVTPALLRDEVSATALADAVAV